MSDQNKQIIHLPVGAYTIDRNGKAINVDKIVVPTVDDCCMLDCCNKVIKFVDSTGVQREISLQRLYEATLEVATSVTLSGCPTTGFNPTETAQLVATILPATARQTGSWVSSNPLIATVNSTGLITAVAIGTTTITFTASTGIATATCSVTVVAP